MYIYIYIHVCMYICRPTVGDAGVEAVPCGVPTHTCTRAPPALVIGPPAQVNASGNRL